MSKMANVMVVAEGASEQCFVDSVLAPYLAVKNVFVRATQISKKGQKGGDVKFVRAKRDVVNFLKQRADIYVATFIDYYGVKEWPGLDEVAASSSPLPIEIARIMNTAAVEEVKNDFPDGQVERRYIPFTAVHEFEALLFSDVEILAKGLCIDSSLVEKVLEVCGEPERINNRSTTSPSNRLLDWTNGHYSKIARGIVVAEKIGVDKMRNRCPNFDCWLKRLESLAMI